MSGQSRSNKNSPSNPKKGTIATREYYNTDPATDAPESEVEEMPSSTPPTSDKHSSTKHSSKHVRTVSSESMVEITHQRTPSETASDILLNCHEKDMMPLNELDRQARERGVNAEERKRLLLELQATRIKEREEEHQRAENEREAELGEEVGMNAGVKKGKGKGKASKK